MVVDASAMVHALVTEGHLGDQARRRLSETRPQHAPHLIDLEVTSAVRKLEGAGRIESGLAHAAVSALGRAELIRYPHLPLLPRIWELRQTVTPYDAVYVALAEVLELPLVTTDGHLASVAGGHIEVHLLT